MAQTKVTKDELGLSSGVQSYTNSGSGGGTGYYINLGGIKICWGTSGVFSAANGNSYTASLPSGFFTTIQSSQFNTFGAVNTSIPGNWTPNGASTSSLAAYSGGTTGNTQTTWFVIGT